MLLLLVTSLLLLASDALIEITYESASDATYCTLMHFSGGD